jgi:hypothetical protein
MFKISKIEDWRVGENKSGILDRVDEIIELNSLEELMKTRLNSHTTHGIFSDNIKTNDSFVSSNIIVFDFENKDATVEVVSKIFSGINFGINSSSNHMVDKGDGRGVIPRFHLIVPLETPITTATDYKEIVKYLASDVFKISNIYDPSCVVASRYWKKQKETLVINTDKRNLNIKTISSIVKCRRQLKEAREKANEKKSKDNFDVEMFIKSHRGLIDELSLNGFRVNALCCLCGKIKTMGYGKFEVLEVVRGNTTLSDAEVNKTINSLFKN